MNLYIVEENLRNFMILRSHQKLNWFKSQLSFPKGQPSDTSFNQSNE